MSESNTSIAPENPDTAQSKTVVADQPVKEITRDGVHYTLLGTAHVSRASVEAVVSMATSGEFDVIAVELDREGNPSRIDLIENAVGGD